MSAPVATAALAALVPTPALAHAFGQRYDLPLPLDLYLGGAAAAVALTFVLLAVAAGGAARPGAAPRRLDLTRTPAGRVLGHPLLAGGLRVAFAAAFVVVVAACFAGADSPTRNLGPTAVWVLWWVGFAYVSALLGDLWRVVDPLASLFRWGRALVAVLTGPRRAPRPYPAALGRWPAVALFVLFAWTEIVSGIGEHPRVLGALILGYAALTWTGMAVYGAGPWRRGGDAFANAFGLFGRFGITGSSPGGAGLVLRPPAAGLAEAGARPASETAFVLAMLATVTFDGFVETTAWQAVLDWAARSPALRPALLALQGAGYDLMVVLETAAMALALLGFAAAYLLICAASSRMGGGDPGPGEVARTFVLTLVPIAVAYHLAHYLSFLLLAGQLAIPLASDPFALGWDLLGTRDHRLRLDLIGARDVWYLSLGAIVAGHAIAVWLAHVAALRAFPDRRRAMRSQIPVLALMVGYTVASLWILSQPIVAAPEH